MRKGVILLAILLLTLGCISEREVEKPKIERVVANISEIVEHLEEYEGKEVKVTGRSRGNPVLIGEKAYADIDDGTGRVIVIFNPKKFLGMVDVRDGDEIMVKGILRTSKDYGEEIEKIMAHPGIPYLIEATEIQVLPKR